jgi:hypothetical protein
MQNHCERFFAKFVGKALQTLAMFLAIYFAKLCTFLQSFLQNYCQIMQTLAKKFSQDYEHWSQRVGGNLFDGFFSFLGAGICGKLGSINTAVTLPATQLPLKFWEFSNC